MRVTESNIFEELDYAYFATEFLTPVESAAWMLKRYGIDKATKMIMILNSIKQVI